MKQTLITAGIAALVASLVCIVGFALVGNQSGDGFLGGLGITRFPNSGMAMRYLNISTTPGTATAGSDGSLTVGGSSSFTGTTDITGEFNPDAIKSTVVTLTGNTTSSITAAQICDSGIIQWTPTGVGSSSTLPTAVALQADCLDVMGSYTDILFENLSGAASTTIFAAGASSTIEYAASSTIASTVEGGDGAILRFYSSTSTTSNAAMVKIKIIPFND